MALAVATWRRFGGWPSLSAVARYAQWATHPAPGAVPATPSNARQVAGARLQSFAAGRLPAEHEARAILEAYGVAGPAERFVTSAQEAAKVAVDIGFPVVLKCLVMNMVHKSDAGMVRLRLASVEAVRMAADDMLERAARPGGQPVLGLLVQKMIAPVAEILVGARVDAEFGPLIVVGNGGINVELYRDVAVRIAPIDEAESMAALASTTIGRVLDGWRGGAVGDRAAAAQAVSAVSRFIADFAGQVREVEINPLAVLAQGSGCLALDCVIVPRSFAASGQREPAN